MTERKSRGLLKLPSRVRKIISKSILRRDDGARTCTSEETTGSGENISGEATGGEECMSKEDDGAQTPTSDEVTSGGELISGEATGSGECMILRLPTEVLDPILALVLERDEAIEHPDSRTFEAFAASLARTCRYFANIVTPYLYSSLYVLARGTVKEWNPEDEPQLQRSRRLLRTLRETPQLRSLCRTLHIDGGSEQRPSGSPKPERGLRYRSSQLCLPPITIAELVVMLNGIIEFRIGAGGGFLSNEPNFDYREMIRTALEHATSLKILTIRFMGGRGFTCHDIMESLCDLSPDTRLEKLDIEGMLPRIRSGLQVPIGAGLAPGTAPITDLTLFKFNGNESSLEMLLRWPRSISKLNLRRIYLDTGEGVTWTILHRMLIWHKDSLTHLCLKEFYGHGRRDMDEFSLADFPNLRKLWLPSTFTGRATARIPKLVAPNLDFLCWDLTGHGWICRETYDNFQRDEEAWLRAYAAASSEFQSISLKRIHIMYAPDHALITKLAPRGASWSTDIYEREYPWDRMDRIGHDFLSLYGIRLTYDPPSATREEYLEEYSKFWENGDLQYKMMVERRTREAAEAEERQRVKATRVSTLGKWWNARKAT